MPATTKVLGRRGCGTTDYTDPTDQEERGRRALRAPDGVRADHLLYLEILARIGGCAGGKNVDDMTDELIAHFGSAEAALTAVKYGQVGFQKITDDDRSNAA
jgi:hypothetical protein